MVQKKQLLWGALNSDRISVMVSPNKKFAYVSLIYKEISIVRTLDKTLTRYNSQGREDWNRGRWLDNERMFFQYWSVPNGNMIVIYNPFTGEQKNIQLDLPNPYIVYESLGKVAWVKADIDPALKRALYNDQDERLVLWDLDTQKEIASLPPLTDVIKGIWSPDGKEFAVPSPSTIGALNELFIIDKEGTVKKTSFNQKYPFVNVSTPS
jgi:hypothetical protein